MTVPTVPDQSLSLGPFPMPVTGELHTPQRQRWLSDSLDPVEGCFVNGDDIMSRGCLPEPLESQDGCLRPPPCPSATVCMVRPSRSHAYSSASWCCRSGPAFYLSRKECSQTRESTQQRGRQHHCRVGSAGSWETTRQTVVPPQWPGLPCASTPVGRLAPHLLPNLLWALFLMYFWIISNERISQSLVILHSCAELVIWVIVNCSECHICILQKIGILFISECIILPQDVLDYIN